MQLRLALGRSSQIRQTRSFVGFFDGISEHVGLASVLAAGTEALVALLCSAPDELASPTRFEQLRVITQGEIIPLVAERE